MRYSPNFVEHAHLYYACSDLVLLICPGDTVDYGGVVGARTANNGVLCVSASATLHERAWWWVYRAQERRVNNG